MHNRIIVYLTEEHQNSLLGKNIFPTSFQFVDGKLPGHKVSL